ncbi:MAG: hypothetical protein CMK06_00480 [Ponticaulis sp.]|nr:hypothetical protein [Ponticaulis sp.]|tara:strand:+ start:22768 stop:23526 length:759 start_codon:yes stop_codon:yes gene_type:complete
MKRKFLRRTAPGVRNLGPDHVSGGLLIEYMLSRVGLSDLSETVLLDVGCGIRFANTISELGLAVRKYIGIEIDAETIEYLRENFSPPEFEFHQANQKNAFYNPQGSDDFVRLAEKLSEPADLTGMFSVITHQCPEEAAETFRFAQAATRPDGKLFFSAFVHGEGHAPFETGEARSLPVFRTISDDAIAKLAQLSESGLEYFEWDESRPGFMSGYTLPFLTSLVEQNGWEVVDVAPPWPNDLPIQTSFVCKRK